MQKELDLTTANIARQKYDVERIKRKSIQDSNNSKRQQVRGELYRGKRVDKRHIKRVGMIVAAAAVAITVGISVYKGVEHAEIVDQYKIAEYQRANKELSAYDSIRFLESHDVSSKERYDNYIDALESLDDADYTFFGNRVDGTHNTTVKLDPEAFQLSDKQKDAIDIAVTEELEEYKTR